MRLNLDEMIQQVISAKTGQSDFALFFMENEGVPYWTAEIGNSNPHVNLGEVEGDIRAKGASAYAAVESLLSEVLRCQ